MVSVFKWEIEVADEFRRAMPVGAEVLSVDVQRDVPCFWAKVDTGQGAEERTFVVRGTGHAFDGHEGKFLGTFQLEGGSLVFHLFEHRDL